MDLAHRLDALERVMTRMGVRVRQEQLPDEAHVDGGLCRIDGELVLYVSPAAPPWRRAQVMLDALRRLPHRDVWLPPEIRRLLPSEETCDGAPSLLRLKDTGEL